MKRWQSFAWAIAAYVLTLIATLPATLVDSIVANSSNSHVRLAVASGTLWSGSAQLEVIDDQHRLAATKQITWRFSPRALLAARLALDVTSDASEHFSAAVSFSAIQLSAVDIALPASALILAAPRLGALSPSGTLRLRTEQMTISRSAASGDATVLWQNAGSALTSVSPLGNYELSLHAVDSTMQASLRTLDSGPLQLNGTGSWRLNDAPAFSARAQINRQYQDKLAPLLRLIARPNSDGSFALQLNCAASAPAC